MAKRQQVFTLKVDEDTYNKLERMAVASERSKGAIVRLLIRCAPEDFATGLQEFPASLADLLKEE